MARLLLDGKWFEPIQADSIYESDLENLILEYAETLYPNYWVIKYKRIIKSEYGSAVPDLALIEKNYRSWYICEVELGSHDLFSHVVPQVSVFCNARVGDEEANYISGQNELFDQAKLSAMMKGAPPGVIVLVNSFDPIWRRALVQWGALVGFIELYRDNAQRTILRINGDDLTLPDEVLSECVRDQLLPNALQVFSPAPLESLANPDLELWYQGGWTAWKVLKSGGSWWLLPKDRCPLPPKEQRFIIRRDPEQRLWLERAIAK